MQDRKRLTNILIAGTLTVLMLTVFLAFRGTNTAVADTTVVETAVVQTTDDLSDDVATLQAQVEALQAQNSELREALTTMQSREAEYQAQIEAANQTITELSAQSGTLAFGGETLQARPGGHNHNH
jgi:peptidoglycan hydrolase CwlO-like protein